MFHTSCALVSGGVKHDAVTATSNTATRRSLLMFVVMVSSWKMGVAIVAAAPELGIYK